MNFVTGATGLVGSHLVNSLLQKEEKVKALKRPGSDISMLKKVLEQNGNQQLFERIEWADGDILDPFSVLDGMEGCNYVYHCAAVVSFVPRERKEMMKINIEGTANVVNAALELGVKKFCHVSSIASLGRNTTREVVTEDTHWKTSPENSYYAISKYGAEREVWRGMEEGLEVVIVNPSVILGPGNADRGSNKMFRLAQKGISHYTSGSTGFVDVRDVVKSMIILMESDIKNERFIISAENLCFRDFFNSLHDEFGKKRPSNHAGPFLSGLAWRLEKIRRLFTGGDPLITKETALAARQAHYFSNEKIKKVTGIEFIPIENSVKEYCRFYISRP